MNDCEECARLKGELQTAREELATLRADIDKFWHYVENGWDIEPRDYFEKEAPTNGFGSPLAQAAHHVWKRDPRVQKLTDENSRLQPYVQHKDNCESRKPVTWCDSLAPPNTQPCSATGKCFGHKRICGCGLLPDGLTPVELEAKYPQAAESIEAAFPEAFNDKKDGR